MAVRVRDTGNVLRSISALRVRDAGAQRSISTGKARDSGGALQIFFTAMSAAIAPPDYEVTQSGTTPNKPMNGPLMTANATGGVAPYTYQWTFSQPAGSPPAAILGGSSTVQSVRMTTTLNQNESTTGVASCTITDAAGAKATAASEFTFTYVGYTPL